MSLTIPDRTLVLDAEIARCIPDKKKPRAKRDDGTPYDYCEGWGDHAGMGIAVVCTYSFLDDAAAAFVDGEQEALQRTLDRHDHIVTHNGDRFDRKLLEACWGITFADSRSYDLFLKAKEAAGVGTFAKGYALDALAKANGHEGKSGHGASAPKLWQDGHRQEVIDYCHDDVAILRELLQAATRGPLLGGERRTPFTLPNFDV